MIKLPRGYLSWTQLNLWENYPELYKEIYFQGKKQFESERLKFGKKFAELREGIAITDDKLLELARIVLPSLPTREKEITAWLKIGKDKVKILGKPDGIDMKMLALVEDKTGKKWTQKMADNAGQLTFYCLIIWLRYKKLLKKILLNWIETQGDEGGRIMATGKFQTFTTTRKLSDLFLMIERVITATKEISKAYQEFSRSNKKIKVK